MVQLAIHAKAVNLARRYTVQNENDLMQEDFCAEDTFDSLKKSYDHSFCQELASHLHNTKSLPSQCNQYDDVVKDLKKRDRDTVHPAQFLG